MSFLNRYAFLLLLFITIVVTVEFLTQEPHFNSRLYATESTASSVTKPINWSFYKIFSSIGNIYHNYFDLVNIRKKYEILEQENVKLQVKLNVAQNFAQENQKLKQLLNLKSAFNFEFVVGKIIGYDPSLTYQSIKINLGKKDGVKPGMGAVAPEGVVGIIIRTQRYTSDLLLLTDPNSSLDALIARNQSRGVLQGKLSKKMQFKYFDHDTNIRNGDTLVTSGLTGSFPANMPIGRVTNIIKNQTDFSQLIEVEPSVNVIKLTELLIIKHNDPAVELIQTVAGANWIDHIMKTESESANDAN